MPEPRKYRPSNGSEGEWFMDKFCENCLYEKWTHTMNDKDAKCDILSNSMLYDLNDPKYPAEWTYDAQGHATCTKYKHWDWGSDDDPDGINEPPPAPINDPDQIIMPFMVIEGDIEVSEPEQILEEVNT